MAQLEDEFGDIISKAMRGLGIDSRRLSEVTGISADDIAGIAAYELIPQPEQISALAKALSLSAEKLIGIADRSWQPDGRKTTGPNVEVEHIGILAPGGYVENCYILTVKPGQTSAIVDPGGSADRILRRLDERGLIPECILLTHTHADHIGGVGGIVEAHPDITVAAFRASSVCPSPARCLDVRDGDTIALGGSTITAFHTPGHTEGSTCYHTDGVLFSGDTMFAGSIGGSLGPRVYEGMLWAIRSKLLSLPDETVVFPGHGPSTTIGEEKEHNPFF